MNCSGDFFLGVMIIRFVKFEVRYIVWDNLEIFVTEFIGVSEFLLEDLVFMFSMKG